MDAFSNSLIATILVSLVSLVGIASFWVNEKLLRKVLLSLVGLSAGALLGGAFLHLIPEATEAIGGETVGIYVIVGFCVFLIIEKGLHWHHCHKEGGTCKVHTFTYMSLIGDGVHNFIDGLIIYASFAINFDLGVVTTIAVISHEIPQEIGDFAVLVHGGFSKIKALAYNFISALAAILGAIAGYFLSGAQFNAMLLPLAAGGFIYIAASDLIPELRKEPGMSKSVQSFALFAVGILIMYSIKAVFGG